MTAPLLQSAAPETVSRQHACQRLGIGARQLRGLIGAGRLEEIGAGHAKRITGASLAKEVQRREKNGNQERQKPEISAKLERTLPDFHVPGLDGEKDRVQDGDSSMILTFPPQVFSEQPIARLVSISRAAALVGVSDDTLRKAVALGQVPSVELGRRRRIDVETLRDWARGKGAK